jgi:glycine hydroxymethyltransferase
MGAPEMAQIANLIARAVRADPATGAGGSVLADVAEEVTDLVGRFPAYPRTQTPPSAAPPPAPIMNYGS